MNIAWGSGTSAGLWEGVSLYRRRRENELGTCWGGFSNQPNGNHPTLAQSGLFMCAAGVACSCVQLVWPVHVCSWCGLFMCAQSMWPQRSVAANSPYGLCGSKTTLNLNSMRSGLRSGVAVLDCPVLTARMVFVDVKRRLNKKVCGQLVSGNT